MKKIIFSLIFLIICTYSGQSQKNLKKKEQNVIYILLDRNSPKINYRERTYTNSQGFLVDRFYNLKSYGCYPHNIIEVTFIHYDPKFNFSYYQYLNEINFSTIKKSVKFLDSISYVDENFVIHAKLDFEKKLRNSQIFILDKGTIKNDSIMIYSAIARYDGFEE